ncbi:uncharacterized protein LTR77_002565 [Saxophila tyrrhenica]|uniref:Uncharacterized protein n=1 Tax=Saxophila tyrrhenica TaxID=1690608 RepID=A0AAV9PJM0_9PEZI|nr:hypothetical protein LTR77_002565 [Saxophila tyrrhenica]
MAYVPPHMRKKRVSESNTTDTNGDQNKNKENSKPELPPGYHTTTFSVEEIEKYFWPEGHPQVESPEYRVSHSKTLHDDSAAQPGRLAFVLLFQGANPQWMTENVIYTKSCLELLPQASGVENTNVKTAEESGKSTEGPHVKRNDSSQGSRSEGATTAPPVAVFYHRLKRGSERPFIFNGWYSIEKVTLLEPQSKELARTLELKWTIRDKYGKTIKRERDEDKWQASMNQKWAVVKLAKDEAAQKERGDPKIERLPDSDSNVTTAEKKSVQEMLAEMRLKDTGVSSPTPQDAKEMTERISAGGPVD